MSNTAPNAATAAKAPARPTVTDDHLRPLLLREAEAAKLLGCGRSLVWKLAREGAITKVNLRGAARFTRESVEKVAREGAPR
ncbi:helix-turn-helix domain-containing protein [Rhodoplanes azumiensis]|uniref:Helix-turn-helix domain-containing protein n=1 Tax=Rhodoplanes azumiensis TaxID=1897628 RepID=A0ABW5AS15_9BRAD